LTVVGTSEDRIGGLVDTDSPDPILGIADLAKFNTFLVPEGDLFVTTGHDEVFTGGVELD
jgi:hypothetical protein